MDFDNSLLTAKEARKLMSGIDINTIIASIRKEALTGQSLAIWYNLDSREVEKLTALGYEVQARECEDREKNTVFEIRW